MINAREARSITAQNELLVVSQLMLLIENKIKEAIKEGTISSINFSIPSHSVGTKLADYLRSYGYSVTNYATELRISW